jgi:hypothetical protein
VSPSLDVGLKRTAEMAAIFMIGDGLVGLAQPQRHVDLWRSGWTGIDAFVRPFADRPGIRRVYGLVQIAAGVALAATLVKREGEDRDA